VSVDCMDIEATLHLSMLLSPDFSAVREDCLSYVLPVHASSFNMHALLAYNVEGFVKVPYFLVGPVLGGVATAQEVA
jgi:hypothetical protein